VVVVPAAAQTYVTGVIPYPYRQDADFLYLTGITQQAFMVLRCPSAGKIKAAHSLPDPKFTLFIPAPNPEKERWDGVPLRADAALNVFGADEVFTTNEMPAILRDILRDAASVYYNPEAYGGKLHREVPALRDVVVSGTVKPLKPYTHRMRWVKSPAEIQLMRDSAELSAKAIQKCMQLTKSPQTEQMLAATFEYQCRLGGAQRLAYPAVVAGGSDACTIHYIRNDKMLVNGQMVLMDAGCEYWGYASDVSRTWPVGGRFSAAQREVYEVVLEVHRQCVEQCRSGKTLRQVHNLSVRLISEAVASLGLLGDMRAPAVMAGSYRPFYCHSVGHWLGCDTHDTNTVAHDTPLQPGVVMTIEPGLYIPNDPKYGRYAGIGVRIEDDILITHDGQPAEVLSRDVPIDPDEIERFIQHS